MTFNERILVTALRASLRWSYRDTANHVSGRSTNLTQEEGWSCGYKSDVAAMRAGYVLAEQLSPSPQEGK